MEAQPTQTEKLIRMAEDELAIFSPDSQKIERLRRKIGLSVSPSQQKAVKQELAAQMPEGFISKLLEEQRQTIALPFWGIAGLGLLLGISFRQPVDFLAPAIAFPLAITIQRQGWQLQAKRLVLKTLAEIEARSKQTEESKSSR
ncbi:hypothetical protein [Myxosarcina sp. GI1]|uniref:hypothetical protein n=1 Tax=Myxosarcina sp. GI1 TaxID=1541065 RepID=UPI00056C4EA0|nr:hypothetical protein [Myxosarcina sp. GI1]